ncbi:hypothetical protein Tco_1100140 [Tanacetum coccineum]
MARKTRLSLRKMLRKKSRLSERRWYNKEMDLRIFGHGHDDVRAGGSSFAAPSQVPRLMDYDDEMDEDDV